MTPTAPAPAQTPPEGGRQAGPIVILIRRDGPENWTIEPEDKQSNDRRFEENDEQYTFDVRWRSRNGKNAGQQRPHPPIFFLEGDVFQFRCEPELPFGIGATKNPDVQALPGAPDDPFKSWESGEPGLDGTWISRDGQPLTATVKTSDGKAPGVKAQRFYKFHGWVFDGGEFKPVDPDGYCGG
jgi:hypothetical protein